MLFSDHVLHNNRSVAEKFSWLCIALGKISTVLYNSSEWWSWLRHSYLGTFCLKYFGFGNREEKIYNSGHFNSLGSTRTVSVALRRQSPAQIFKVHQKLPLFSQMTHLCQLLGWRHMSWLQQIAFVRYFFFARRSEMRISWLTWQFLIHSISVWVVKVQNQAKCLDTNVPDCSECHKSFLQ